MASVRDIPDGNGAGGPSGGSQLRTLHCVQRRGCVAAAFQSARGSVPKPEPSLASFCSPARALQDEMAIEAFQELGMAPPRLLWPAAELCLLRHRGQRLSVMQVPAGLDIRWNRFYSARTICRPLPRRDSAHAVWRAECHCFSVSLGHRGPTSGGVRVTGK